MRLAFLLLLFACEAEPELPTPTSEAGEVLERAIAYHDPGGNWATFDASFVFGQGNNRDTITIDLPEEYFAYGGAWGYYVADGQTCRYDHPTDGSAQGLSLASDSCANVRRKRDYHTFLNGLPMKLVDPGTPLEDEVVTTDFHGEEYLRLRVNYPKAGGTFETWEFFFDPETYALGGYQFYRSDRPAGGEYLLLEGETEVGGVKMAREKAWYLRENDKYLVTDVVVEEVVVAERD